MDTRAIRPPTRTSSTSRDASRCRPDAGAKNVEQTHTLGPRQHEVDARRQPLPFRDFGVELLSAADGWCEKERERRWTEDTLVPVYSATKGPASATLLTALEENGLGPETAVREVREETGFAAVVETVAMPST